MTVYVSIECVVDRRKYEAQKETEVAIFNNYGLDALPQALN